MIKFIRKCPEPGYIAPQEYPIAIVTDSEMCVMIVGDTYNTMC